MDYPKESTPALKEVLGLMIMTTCPIAHAFRAAGHDIPTKTEAEQAYVLHWLIPIALEHGENWRKVASDKIKAMQAEHESKPAPLCETCGKNHKPGAP